jgi:hypothetical protein
MRIHTGLGAALAAAALWAGSPAAAGAPDDDLAVVKKATASPAAKRSPAAPRVEASARVADDEEREPPDVEPLPDEEPPPRLRRSSGREPRWLRVRVIEHGRKRGGVTVNLPIGIARALGDDFPIEVGCHRRHHRAGRHCPTLRLGDVLRTLASGEDLVAIDDHDTSVRVWVD